MNLEQATTTSITSFIEYGVLGSVAAVSLCFAAILGWVIIKQAKSCMETTREVVDNNTKAINDFKDSNREALHGVQLAITKFEAKLER